MLFVKIIVVVLLLLIVLSLGAGMFTMVQDRGSTNRTVKFLTFRIALSILYSCSSRSRSSWAGSSRTASCRRLPDQDSRPPAAHAWP